MTYSCASGVSAIAILVLAPALAFAPACAAGLGGPLDESGTGNEAASYDAASPWPDSGSRPQGPEYEASSPGYDSSSPATGNDASLPERDSAASGYDGDPSTGDGASVVSPPDARPGPLDSAAAGSEAAGPPLDSGSQAVCAAPMTAAACTGCTYNCQPNGCYNGYVCDTQTTKCKAPGTCP